MPKLDGTENKTELINSFDTHEQVVRQPHTHSKEEGYKPTEYVEQEFPKVIGVDEDTKEPILAHGPEEVKEPEMIDPAALQPAAPAPLDWGIAEESVEPPTPVVTKAKKEE